ncbi:MAG TPA: YihY/virulence factor BrkB family protein [Vicinamibacterales bacterium]|nr:YihY/virulence factor BrkB family protein [Vicinamibacterales bacterium]
MRARDGSSLLHTADRRLDRTRMSMRALVVLRTFKGAARAWWDDDCTRLGASLAYYTLFAIAPILLVATAIAGMVFGHDAVRSEIVSQLDHLVGREGALAVQGLLEAAAQRPSGVVATLIGGITFLIASTGAFLELQVAFNTIWRVKPRPTGHLYAFVMDRVRSFGLVVAIGFLLLVSLTVTAGLAALNAWLFGVSPTDAYLWTIVNTLVSIVVTTGLFALLLRFLPDVGLRWRDVMTGAVVTAVLFTIGQQVIGLYLGQSRIASSYGAAGSMMILLLWVYYSCQILLFGAEFTRVWAARHGVKVKPEEFAVKDPEAVQPKSALTAVK